MLHRPSQLNRQPRQSTNGFHRPHIQVGPGTVPLRDNSLHMIHEFWLAQIYLDVKILQYILTSR